jgi:hypothetical protein
MHYELGGNIYTFSNKVCNSVSEADYFQVWSSYIVCLVCLPHVADLRHVKEPCDYIEVRSQTKFVGHFSPDFFPR